MTTRHDSLRRGERSNAQAGARVGARLAVLVWFCGCHPLGGWKEFVNPNVMGDRIRTIAVLAGSDRQATLQMTARSVTRLREAGLTIVQPGGLWESEAAVMEGLCSAEDQERKYDGVLFITWDRLTLRDCETQAVAYDVRGGHRGVDEMTERLMSHYLRVQPRS